MIPYACLFFDPHWSKTPITCRHVSIKKSNRIKPAHLKYGFRTALYLRYSCGYRDWWVWCGGRPGFQPNKNGHRRAHSRVGRSSSRYSNVGAVWWLPGFLARISAFLSSLADELPTYTVDAFVIFSICDAARTVSQPTRAQGAQSRVNHRRIRSDVISRPLADSRITFSIELWVSLRLEWLHVCYLKWCSFYFYWRSLSYEFVIPWKIRF